MRLARIAIVMGLSSLTLASCGSFRSATSPDVIYDNSADAARELQVPPDLTDVSNAEQFILPGTSDAAVARNTLLPQFNSVRFVREGDQSWLEFTQAPEEIWPLLLAFTRQEKFLVEQTEPVAGVITTQWRADSAVPSSSLLKNLIKDGEGFSRVAFRLERSDSGSRLFARSQVANEASIAKAREAQWPASSHDPEQTSALLARLLAFVGVEEQKVRGILSDEQAQAVIEDATLQTTGSGSQLVVYKGFLPAYEAVLSALEALDYPVSSKDDGVGRIEFSDAQQPLVVDLTPTHISEVRIGVTSAEGRRLPADVEQAVLRALLGKLA